MAEQENDSRLQATRIEEEKRDGYIAVSVKEKDKPVGSVVFGPSQTVIVLEKAYTNWSRQVVRVAKATAGIK